MRILLVLLVVVALTGVGVANAVLLGYGADRTDPVGRLSPLTHVAPTVVPVAPVHPTGHGNEGPDD